MLTFVSESNKMYLGLKDIWIETAVDGSNMVKHAIEDLGLLPMAHQLLTLFYWSDYFVV